MALQSIVTDESVTLGDVAKLVAADSALAARVLQMVNSAFFRLPRKILARLPDNQSWISEVILQPRVNSTLVKSRATAIKHFHEMAHRDCFIAQSIKTKVRIESVGS